MDQTWSYCYVTGSFSGMFSQGLSVLYFDQAFGFCFDTIKYNM